jgi:hypothetical protein
LAGALALLPVGVLHQEALYARGRDANTVEEVALISSG